MPVSPKHAHAVFLATLTRFENKLKGKIVADKAEFIKATEKRYAEHGTPNFFDLVHDHQETLFKTLATHYRVVIPVFGSLSLSQVKSRSFKDDEEDDLFTKLADRWVHTEGLKRSKLIADTSEADVLKAISDGLENGDGTAEIARAIGKVTDLSGWRSEMIARTETHAAANYAGIESVRDAQDKLDVVMEKAWAATMDDRTREDHAAMDPDNYIGMDELFEVGGEMMDSPGDPSASADQTCNCRCTVYYREARE